MIRMPRGRAAGQRPLIVVHGHRDGNAVGGKCKISDECVARVRIAETATRRFRSELVLFCGAGVADHESEARQMAAVWRGPPVRALLDERSEDSAQNVQEALAWAHALGATELVVVSSWWHLRLRLYYARVHREIPVRHLSTRRCKRILAHLAHELRYGPRAMRSLVHRPIRGSSPPSALGISPRAGSAGTRRQTGRRGAPPTGVRAALDRLGRTACRRRPPRG